MFQNETVGKLNQIHFAILDHKDHYYSLAETARFIDMKVIHVTYFYENGKEMKKETISNLKDCGKEDFTKNELMKNYYK